MRLSRQLTSKSIQIPLQSLTKEKALEEMVHLLAESHGLENEQEILERVQARERKMSTGIGYGVAVPHAKYDGIQDIKIAVGISKAGIPFEAIDDELVYIIFIMISPTNTAGPHIQTLSAISKLMSYEEMRSRLRAVKNAEEFLQALTEGEAKYL